MPSRLRPGGGGGFHCAGAFPFPLPLPFPFPAPLPFPFPLNVSLSPFVMLLLVLVASPFVAPPFAASLPFSAASRPLVASLRAPFGLAVARRRGTRGTHQNPRRSTPPSPLPPTRERDMRISPFRKRSVWVSKASPMARVEGPGIARVVSRGLAVVAGLGQASCAVVDDAT